MKILFGGTFDPVHNGHIALAKYISDQFNHVVSLMPLSGVPNYKKPPQASLKERLDMLEIIANKYSKQINIDYNEANLDTYSPTVFTLRRLREIYGNDEPFYFIIGGDSLVSLDIWDEWNELFELTNFIVATRTNYSLDKMSSQLKNVALPRITKKQVLKPHGSIIMTHFDPIDISSTDVRKKILYNQPIDNLIDSDIEKYIKTHNIYSKSLTLNTTNE